MEALEHMHEARALCSGPERDIYEHCYASKRKQMEMEKDTW